MIKATLIDHLGDDLRVVNAARVSFDKESSYVAGCPVCDEGLNCFENDVTCGFVSELGESDARLIRYLARNGHWTPFSHPQITLREEVPIFVARQRFKHMVGFTYNEVSRRYVSDEPEFYNPDVWRKAAESIKQGSLDEAVDLKCFWANGDRDDDETLMPIYSLDEALQGVMGRIEFIYKAMLKAGVAPEMARMVLPQSMMTSYYVTGSLAAFARAYKQRSDSHSQKEIRDLAAQWDTIIRPLFPVSWAALVS